MSGFRMSLGLGRTGSALLVTGEAIELAARFDVVPSGIRLAAIDTLIAALKLAGAWKKFDAFYVLAAHTAQAARQNWIGDRHNLVLAGSPEFTVDTGYQGNGSSDYLDTGFNPSLEEGHFQRDHASLGFWSLTDGSNARFEMGLYQSDLALGRADIRVRRENGQMAAYLNDQTFVERPAGGSALGLFSVSRIDGATRVFRHDDSYSNAASAPTVTLIDGSIQLLSSTNWTSGRSARRCAAAWIGAGLSQSEHDAVWRALKTYLQGVGAV